MLSLLLTLETKSFLFAKVNIKAAWMKYNSKEIDR